MNKQELISSLTNEQIEKARQCKNNDELLKVIAEETRNAIQADRCTVFLWDKDTNELYYKTK